jgi:hypothetical protein
MKYLSMYTYNIYSRFSYIPICMYVCIYLYIQVICIHIYTVYLLDVNAYSRLIDADKYVNRHIKTDIHTTQIETHDKLCMFTIHQ